MPKWWSSPHPLVSHFHQALFKSFRCRGTHTSAGKHLIPSINIWINRGWSCRIVFARTFYHVRFFMEIFVRRNGVEGKVFSLMFEQRGTRGKWKECARLELIIKAQLSTFTWQDSRWLRAEHFDGLRLLTRGEILRDCDRLRAVTTSTGFPAPPRRPIASVMSFKSFNYASKETPNNSCLPFFLCSRAGHEEPGSA